MKVDILTLQTLFQKQARYEVPAFQRPYVWDETRQWEPLWDDVRNTAEHFLEVMRTSNEGSAPSQVPSHFLGAVVLQQQPSPAGAPLDLRIVVDGQQRLTTLQLLIDAVQEELERHGYQQEANLVALLVKNNDAFCVNVPDNAFKVWPTINDQDAFRCAMRNDLSTDEHENSRIVEAHKFFRSQVQDWLDQNPDEGELRAKTIERVVALKLEMVIIDLDVADNPLIIFETLNARGTPLLPSELVKNLVLFKAVEDGIVPNVQEAAGLWSFDQDWWRQETGQGRNARARVEACLNHWLSMRTQKEIAQFGVFPSFRDYAAGKPIASVVADLSNIGSIYRSLETAPNPEMETFLYRREAMQAGVITPVLLWLLSEEVPQAQLRAGLHSLESYLVRRMVCRMSTRSYVDIFVGLVSALEEAGASRAGNTITKFLQTQSGERGEWPNDRRLERDLINSPLFSLLTRGRLRMVLEGIEGELMTPKAGNQTVPRNLTIEHIMPQRWRTNWPLDGNVEDPVTAAEDRDRIIHSIGNLTLVNNRLNASLSNAPWGQKRTEFAKHDNLFLNKTLLEKAPEVWDEAAIAERAKRLCQVAAKVWPYADKIKA